MNNLQILQNKAAKIVLDRPYFSSATDALNTLGWTTLEQRRLHHRCLFVFKCLNNNTSHGFELLANREIHHYNTRYKDNLRPPKVSRNWGKQRLAYQAITDWNNLDRKIKLSTSISTLKSYKFLNIFHSYVVYACLPCKIVYLVQDLSENHFVRKLPENKY
jgi:hypothetical protein